MKMTMSKPYRHAVAIAAGSVLLLCGCGERESSTQVFYADCAAAAGGDGSRAHPFATVYEVRDGLRALREQGLLATNRPVEVVFARGDYFVTQPIELTKEDGGTPSAPVVWKSRDAHGARFVGGKVIDAGLFKPLKDEATLKRIPAEARDKILVADLSALLPEELPKMYDVGSRAHYTTRQLKETLSPERLKEYLKTMEPTRQGDDQA